MFSSFFLLAASWLYDTVCGIRDITEEDPRAAGFKRFRLAPRPGGTLTDAAATLETRDGTIRSSWKRADGTGSCDFTLRRSGGRARGRP